MALTAKQKAWNQYKKKSLMDRMKPRGVAVTLAEPRRPVKCTCIHRTKHHKWSGRCRPGCPCAAGIEMARR